MQMRTLPKWISFEALRAAIVYPLAQCEAEPLAAEHIPLFKECLDAWTVTHAQKLDLDDQAEKAHVRRDRAGLRINRAADRVSVEILLLIGGDRTKEIYTHFFGNKPVSAFKKIKMSDRIRFMTGWVSSLNDSGRPTLIAIVPEVTAALKEADDAHQQKINVDVAKSRFRDLGERRQLIDKVNAVCKSVHGQLAKLPHEILGLPPDFADRFFRRDEGRDNDKHREEAPTVDSVTAKCERLAAELAESEALLADLKSQEADKDKAAAALEADKAALAELQKIMAQNEKLVAKLKAKIEASIEAA